MWVAVSLRRTTYRSADARLHAALRRRTRVSSEAGVERDERVHSGRNQTHKGAKRRVSRRVSSLCSDETVGRCLRTLNKNYAYHNILVHVSIGYFMSVGSNGKDDVANRTRSLTDEQVWPKSMHMARLKCFVDNVDVVRCYRYILVLFLLVLAHFTPAAVARLQTSPWSVLPIDGAAVVAAWRPSPRPVICQRLRDCAKFYGVHRILFSAFFSRMCSTLAYRSFR